MKQILNLIYSSSFSIPILTSLGLLQAGTSIAELNGKTRVLSESIEALGSSLLKLSGQNDALIQNIQTSQVVAGFGLAFGIVYYMNTNSTMNYLKRRVDSSDQQASSAIEHFNGKFTDLEGTMAKAVESNNNILLETNENINTTKVTLNLINDKVEKHEFNDAALFSDIKTLQAGADNCGENVS